MVVKEKEKEVSSGLQVCVGVSISVCAWICIFVHVGGWVRNLGFVVFFMPRTPSFPSQHLEKRILRVVDRGLENLGSNTNFFLSYYEIILSLSLSFVFCSMRSTLSLRAVQALEI